MRLDLDWGTFMQQMRYPNYLAFVEGSMERMFINNNFNYVSVIPVSNGVTWTVDALCKQIVSMYKARNFYGDGVIVWVDRERRPESADFIYNCIYNALVNAGAPVDRIHLLISDMMCENIILSDCSLMKSVTGNDGYIYEFEGKSGKSILKAILSNLNIAYKETSIGVKLLKQVRLSNCREHSASVSRFLATFQADCWWLTAKP